MSSYFVGSGGVALINVAPAKVGSASTEEVSSESLKGSTYFCQQGRKVWVSASMDHQTICPRDEIVGNGGFPINQLARPGRGAEARFLLPRPRMLDRLPISVDVRMARCSPVPTATAVSIALIN